MPQCLYKPARAQQNSQCTAEATTPYGYCNKHKTTVAAKKAKEEYEKKAPVKEEETSVEPSSPEPKQKTPEKSQSPKKPASAQKVENPPANPPSESQKKTVKIVRNKWDNFEHTETGIVFDLNTKKAYGVQQANGKVRRLLDDDIKTCVSNGFGYYLFKEDSKEAKLPAPVKQVKTTKATKNTRKKVESESEESSSESEEESEEESESEPSESESESESSSEEEEEAPKKKAPLNKKGKQEESEEESEDESEEDESEDE